MDFLPAIFAVLIPIHTHTQELRSLDNPALLADFDPVLLVHLQIERFLDRGIDILVFNIHIEHIHYFSLLGNSLKLLFSNCNKIHFLPVKQRVEPVVFLRFLLFEIDVRIRIAPVADDLWLLRLLIFLELETELLLLDRFVIVKVEKSSFKNISDFCEEFLSIFLLIIRPLILPFEIIEHKQWIYNRFGSF